MNITINHLLVRYFQYFVGYIAYKYRSDSV